MKKTCFALSYVNSRIHSNTTWNQGSGSAINFLTTHFRHTTLLYD